MHVSHKPLLALIFQWELDHKEKAPHTFAVCSHPDMSVTDTCYDPRRAGFSPRSFRVHTGCPAFSPPVLERADAAFDACGPLGLPLEACATDRRVTDITAGRLSSRGTVTIPLSKERATCCHPAVQRAQGSRESRPSPHKELGRGSHHLERSTPHVKPVQLSVQSAQVPHRHRGHEDGRAVTVLAFCGACGPGEGQPCPVDTQWSSV